VPKATNDTTTHTASRRGLLGRSGAALLAGAAAATVARAAPLAAPVAAGDDAELIRLHQSFLAEEEIIHAWNANTVTWAVGEAASNRWWAALRAMQDIPALTAEGVRIKADCSLRAFALGAAGDSGPAEDFAIAFLAQLSGRAAA
jgi:hypothetical protein